MRWRLILAVTVAAFGLTAVESSVRAQDSYTGPGNGYYNNGNYTYAPYAYSGYGAYQPGPYPSGYAYPQSYPYYGNHYYGASPAYGYTYGGPILYGRFGHQGRVGFRFGWW
jgi:hypothetical protein